MSFLLSSLSSSFCLYIIISTVLFFQSFLSLSPVLHSPPLLSGLASRRHRKSVIEEVDRQRLISSAAARAIAAHQQCTANGTIPCFLPRSESTVTLLSDNHPLTTPNPLYQESTQPSPDPSSQGRPPSSGQSPSSGSQGLLWACKKPGETLWDSESESDEERSGFHGSRDEVEVELELLSWRSSLAKLSVREQARHFEQQAAQVEQQRSTPAWDPRGDSLDLDNLLLFPSMPPHSLASVGKDVLPCIIITGEDGETPPSVPRTTPPVLRKFSSSISSYMTVGPCEVLVEIIPDPPDQPPPPPPFSF